MNKWTKSVFVLMAASLAVTAPISVGAAKESSASVQEESKGNGAIDEKLIKKIEKSLEKLAQVVPYVKNYPITEYEINEKSSRIEVNKYQSKEKKAPYVSLYVDQNTGEVKFFSHITGKGDFSSTYPLEDAKKKATAFMKQWYGEDMAGYQLDEEATEYNSSILFRKTINGVPFRNDTLNFAINTEGQIQHLASGDGLTEQIEIEQDIRKIQFADPNKVHAKEKVEKMFASAMTPIYGQSADGNSYKFLYTPYLGEIYASIGKELPANKNNKIIQFEPKAKQAIIKSKEEAAAFLAAKTGYDPAKGRSTFKEESDPKTGISNYLWMTEDELIANIFFETKTGKVTNYQVLDTKRKSEADKKLSEEQALKAAVEAMSEFLPSTDKEMAITANRYEAGNNLYEFDFTMLHQGYPVDGMIRQAHVDATTGKATLLDWRVSQNMKLPDSKNAMTKEEAAKKFLKKYPLKLYYSLDENNKNAAKLVYLSPLVPKEDIDALTGEFYTYGEEEEAE
ncbi:YcdB/YcdC domain-containing protein [Brevibacillus sp. 179-C 1.1 NHS]|uniref:YcdB/YcdC domain-containing protein n=1 Tax=Brevibacillus sp. 179-C 1.1 NHS TaxID=3235177 RepID=UPI0039A182CD